MTEKNLIPAYLLIHNDPRSNAWLQYQADNIEKRWGKIDWTDSGPIVNGSFDVSTAFMYPPIFYSPEMIEDIVGDDKELRQVFNQNRLFPL
jgi:hypothetical protein